MHYYSLSNPNETTNFAQAVVNGIAPDRGLYFPSEIPRLPASFFDKIEEMDVHEMALTAIQAFIGDEIPKEELERIVKTTLDFEFL